MNKLKRGIGKILGLLATLVFAVAALFGCGPNAKPPESPEPTTPPVTSENPVPNEEVTITIRYVYPDGSESTVTETVKVGSTYSIASPKLEGYYADQSVVTGVASEDVTIVVTYRELTDEMVVKKESGSLGTMHIGANDLITAESGVAFGFFISGAAKASDWNPLINVDGYILTHGNLDSWTVDEHNCYPLLTQFGGAWDCIIQDEEAFLIVNVQRDAISYYRNGELVLRYAREDAMNGTPAKTVAAFIDGFLAGVEANGFTLDASYSSLRDLYLCRGLAEEEVVKLYESATSDQTSYQLTIRYVYEDGSEAAPSEIRTVAENAGVAVASPVIDGFTPDQRTVSIESMSEDMTITVVYTQAVGRTYVQTYTQEGSVAAGTTIPASPEVTASTGVSIAFYLGGSSSETSWNPLVNAGGYIVTYGNLDSWSKDEHNLYPSLTAHGGAWDALVTGEEVYIIINASEDGIDIYKNGELALRYAPSDRMNGAPAQFASTFIERFLANVEASGFVFAETAYEIRDLKVGTALPDQQVREFYEEQLMSGSTVLSIRYVDEEGNLLVPILHKAVEPGKGYQISSPRIPGYTTDTNEVVGRMGEESVEIEVVYRAIGMKTLTILSVFEDGSEALAPQTYEYSMGGWYSVRMPLLAGYSASDELISGNLSEDTTRIVVYQKDPYQKATVAYDRIVNPAPLRNTNASKENGLFVSFFLAGSQSENSWGSLLNAGGWKITYGNLDAFPMAKFNCWPGLTEHGGAWDALITSGLVHVIVNVTMDGIAIYRDGALAIYYGADEWMNALEGEKTKMTVSTFITEFLNYAEQDILCIGDKCYDITHIRAGVALNETEIEMEYRRAIGENPHVVTVAHVDENGQSIAPSETVFIQEGSTYSATAKQILGYEAVEVPTATIYGDRVLLVKYASVNVYNVNITYVFEDGREAAPAVSYRVNEGTAYSLPSPYIIGYTTDDQLYEGSGLTGNLTAEVVYREDRWQRMFEAVNGPVTETLHLEANPAVTQETGVSFSFFLSDALTVGDWSSLINAGGLKITYANLDSWMANEHNMWPAATAFGGEWNVMLTAVEGDYFTINVDARGVAFYKNGAKVLFYAANETMNGTGAYQVSQFVTDFISAYRSGGVEFGEVLATVRDLKVGVGQTDYEVLATYAKAIGQEVHSLLVTFVDENGTAVADPYFELAYGENNPYDVAIPSIPGMRPDRTTLTGTNVGDEEITVTYTAIEYSLTIRYIDELGNPIAENYQTTLAYGDSYDVTSPTISEKTPDRLSVSGVIDENSEETIEIVVTYYGTTYEFIAMLNGVQAVSEELPLNAALPLPTCTTEGYEYQWFTNEAMTDAFVGTTMPGEDLTLYGKTVATAYTASFVVEGNVVGTDTFTVETLFVTPPAMADRTGCIFAWENYTLGAQNVTIQGAYYVGSTIGIKTATGYVHDWFVSSQYLGTMPEGDFSFDFRMDSEGAGVLQWQSWLLQIGNWKLRPDKWGWDETGTVTYTDDWLATEDWATFAANTAKAVSYVNVSRTGADVVVTVTTESLVNGRIYHYSATCTGFGTASFELRGTSDTAVVTYYVPAQRVISGFDSCYAATEKEGDFTVRYLFRNQGSGVIVWENWLAKIDTWTLRADKFSLGIDNAAVVYDTDWTLEHFLPGYMDAEVDLTITRTGNTVTVSAVITPANTEYGVWHYTATYGGITSSSVRVGLGGENATITIYSFEQS